MSVDIKALEAAARQAQTKAYAPYSDFRVGAAVLDDRGQITAGANIENASYPAGCCAERVAIYMAIASGAKKIKALAVITDAKGAARPCGICRQVMKEFASKDFVFYAMAHDEVTQRLVMEELLPFAFGPEALLSNEL